MLALKEFLSQELDKLSEEQLKQVRGCLKSFFLYT